MGWIKEIKNQTQKIKYSQNGEEYWLKYIFDNIGTTNKYLVDLGAWDGVHLSNTKIFRDEGWDSLLVDAKDFKGVCNSFITLDNIIETLRSHNVPEEFDLLSIDLDGNDYWILDKVLTHYKPRVIISEFNSEHPLTEAKTIRYSDVFRFDSTDYYGYTYGAGLKLAERHGYRIIYAVSNINLIYLKSELVTEEPDYKVDMFRHWNVKSNKEWFYL